MPNKVGTFKRIILPGVIFQSVVIAGGYGTGRELVEYFMRFGVWGGLVALCTVSLLVWAALCAVTFEFARVFRAYDYKTLFERLLGRGWPLYEITYFAMMILILAVAASSSGEILNTLFGLPYWFGVVLLLGGIGMLVMGGREVIERILSILAVALLTVYAVFLIAGFTRFGGAISQSLAAREIKPGFLLGGLQYACYNLGVIPAVLFTTRHCTTRRDTFAAGAIAGLIGLAPGVLLYLSMAGLYPGVLTQTLPINYALEAIGWPPLQFVFQLVLFCTLIDTGVGMVYAVTDRARHAIESRGRKTPVWLTPALTVALLSLGVFAAGFGLVDLIAKGYGAMTWAFLALYAVPMLTVGVWKIARARRTRR